MQRKLNLSRSTEKYEKNNLKKQLPINSKKTTLGGTVT